MVKHLAGGSKRALSASNQQVDVRPTIFSVSFSLILTAVLIITNSGQGSSVTESALVDTEAELVAREVASAFPGRQAVSPQIVVSVLGNAISQEAEANALLFGDQVEAEPAVNGQGVDPASSATNNPSSAEAEPGPNDDASLPGEEQSRASVGVVTTTPQQIVSQPSAATTTEVAPVTSGPQFDGPSGPVAAQVASTVVAPATTRPPAPATTQPPATTTTTTTSAPAVLASGNYSVAQVIDGTIGAGDGSNPNEDGPMGRHDSPLYLPQGWDWSQGTTRNPQWGTLGSDQFVEFRCAVIPENGHVPPVDFRINFRNGAYYQYAGDSWSKAFDVDLDDSNHGAYLGVAGQVNADPFASGQGSIQWRQEADGSYSAPWNPDALMMHFWASERQRPTSGQIAEFLTSEVRLVQPDGQAVDLSKVRVLFQCGLDYYNTTGGQGTKVPGPGIGKYHLLTAEWQPDLWVTMPGNQPANSVADMSLWLEGNLPPNVVG